MRPWFARRARSLVPMRSGGGTRLKVLDGLACGRAMVSTTMGAEGIDAGDGEHVMLADGAERVRGGDRARARRPPAGRAPRRRGPPRWRETVYDWRAIGARYAALLEGLAGVSA